jgi:hypothetical protein
MIKAIKTFTALTILAVTLCTTSCIKKDDFDNAPTTNIDPNITTNATVSSVVSLVNATAPQLITADLIFSAIIVADDKSGNYYKEMIVQDSTAGISILLDQPSYYTSLFIGRRVFVKAKGLYIQSVNGTPKIGVLSNGSVSAIPTALITSYITGGRWGLTVVPAKRKLNALTDADLNTLVQFDTVQFDISQVGLTYADAPNKLTVNRNLKDCNGNSLIVRTSGYANFAGSIIPCKAGNVTAIYQKFNATAQVFLRDLNDVPATIERCDGNICTITYLDIDSIRTLFANGATTVPGGVHVKGTVISDYTTSAVDVKNVIVQDGTAGICVRYTTAPNYTLGTQLDLNVGGLPLSEFNGWLQISNAASAIPIAGLPAITPRIVTLADATANFEQYESTLIKVVGATINNGTATTYGALASGLPISDGTSPNSIVLYTRSLATFSGSSTPTSAVSVTGILTQYNTTKQFQIRNLSDVQ